MAKRKSKRHAKEMALQDDEAMRVRIVRKINTIQGFARTCRDSACRRAKACAGQSMRCVRDNLPKPLSPEQQSARLGYVHRLVLERLAELHE